MEQYLHKTERHRRRFLVYGDSNTYGYDPSDLFGGPYPLHSVWTSILAGKFSGRIEILNYGENGRRIPDPQSQYQYAEKLLARLEPDDIFAVMLGHNDLLITTSPKAEVPVRKMEEFIAWFLKTERHPVFFLIAPPYISSEQSPDPYMRICHEESIRMNEGFARLARKYELMFADASGWDIPCAFDEVHFTEEGHRIFADKMAEEMKRMEFL